ncbi:MAG TPA: deoxyribose-phosphate aldolase [Chthoniobacterales bacterium]|jgi:deoxyribose-phosphate aldolase|nr:deoxyribose-phosphate aldolase [Chthoniobacterales bacterium]
MSMTSVQRLGTIQASEELRRNAGMPLDLDWVNQVQANSSAIQSRASTLTSRRTVEQQWQAAWLLRAISCIDLTTLAGDDSPGRIRRLCAKARHPVRDDLLAAMDVRNLGITTAAVCVYPTMVPTAFRALEGSGIRVASVAAAYPGGLSPLKLRLGEIAYAVEAGAAEIDAVITREQVLTASWERLYDEVASFSAACGGACLKVVLATGELATLRNVQKASLVAMMAGADFIKTSTGKEAVTATLETGLAMIRAIREYRERTGHRVGFQAAGGVRHAREALHWLILLKEELEREWLEPELFRIGASSLLNDIEQQLEHYVTGRYSASFRHPAA